MKKQKKKFRETKVAKFMAQHGSKILDTAGDLIPGGQVLKIVADMIDNDPDLPPEAKATAKEMITLEIAQAHEITERWKADVGSDSWLSKNVRPIIALYSFVLFSVVVVFSLIGSDVPDHILLSVGGLCTTITLAYFGVREYGKIQLRKNGIQK